MNLIPKRPPRQPERPSAYPKQMIQPSVPPPIARGATEPSVQPLAHPDRSSMQSDEVDDRFHLSDMATVKCEALRPQEILEMATVKYEAPRPQEFRVRRRAISYPAVVSVRRRGKLSFLARAASLLK